MKKFQNLGEWGLYPAYFSPEMVSADIRTALRGLSALAGVMSLAFSIIVFFVYGFLDPVTWKLVIIGCSVTCFSMLLVGWNILLKRKPSLNLMHEHLMLITVLGAPVIGVTGGSGSPFLAFMGPIAFLGGLMAPTLKRGILFGVVCLPLSLILSNDRNLGCFPPGPHAFFEGDAATAPAHFFIAFGMNAVVMVVMLLIGMSIQAILRRVFGDMFFARQQTLVSLTHRNKELESVASTVAHELKNPLAAIQGLVELMARNTPRDSRDADRIDVILRETGRMARTLDEFRNFTRPLSRLNLWKASLSDLLYEVVNLNEGIAKSRKVDLRLEIREEVDVECDPHKVGQALTNVVQNAIEAMDQGGLVVLMLDAIDVRGVRHARIQVTDNGPGLAFEVKNRLFIPGTTTKKGGSGVGLVIARSICEQHGGTLDLENGAETGCVATLTFPHKAAVNPLNEVNL